MRIIDISEWNGSIDFNAVKQSGVDGVIIRIGFGREPSQIDKSFESYYKQAKKAGLYVGGYFFSYAEKGVTNDFLNEAKNCLNMIKGKEFDLPIFYDIEWEKLTLFNKTQLTQGILTFCETLTKAGYRSGVYTGYYFATELMNISTIYPRYYFWLADWSSKAHLNCDLWQYTSSGSVNGCSGRVDVNRVIDNRLLPKEQKYTIVTNSKLRSEAYCGGSSRIIRGLYKGEQVTLIFDDRYGWSKIRTDDGKEGYVQNTRLNPNQNLSKYPTMKVNARGLRVRADPSTSARIICEIPDRTKVTVRYIIMAGDGAGWAEIAYPTSSSINYCCAKYLIY